jgi:hypothetical protein
MLLDNDVVADGETKASAFSRRLGREERVEHLFLYVGRYASAVIANPDFHTIAKVFGRGPERRLVVAAVCFRPALGRGIKAVSHSREPAGCPAGKRLPHRQTDQRIA